MGKNDPYVILDFGTETFETETNENAGTIKQHSVSVASFNKSTESNQYY
jgi:hypothetical protein